MPVRVKSDLQKTDTFVLDATSTEDPVTVVCRRADNRAVLARKDFFDKVRYIQRNDEGETVTERSFPMGELQLSTIMLVIDSWDLKPDEKQLPYALTPGNVRDLLTPEEFEQLYDFVVEANVVWGGNSGED